MVLVTGGFIPSLFRSIVPWIKKYGTNPITGEVSNDGYIHTVSLLSLGAVSYVMCGRNKNTLMQKKGSGSAVWKRGMCEISFAEVNEDSSL